MKVMASNIRQYNFTQHDELLLDTNIWLFIYGPQKPGNNKAAVYSQALSEIISSRSRIYIDVLIVSEFINTYARLQWDILGRPHEYFKKFRKSQDFKPIAKDIADSARRVLGHCSKIDSGFETVDTKQLIAEYEAGDADFNDQIIAELCRKKGLKLVTDDADFHGQDIPVLTANKKLLV
ncbi:PIN domain-containing protein [Desulfobulbus sp. F5]|nr:PIN domain-containing protein [Desulfobulbus sp. F5]